MRVRAAVKKSLRARASCYALKAKSLNSKKDSSFRVVRV
jgi:hypothetical protein